MEGWPVELELQVRFRDTDAMGHVNNAVYLSYLELARMEYWTRLSGSRDYGAADFILARAELDYKSPARVRDTLTVGVRAGRVGRSSWDFDYRIEDKADGRLVAEGRTVQCRYDYAKRKVLRLDEPFRKKLEQIEGGGAPPRRAARAGPRPEQARRGS